MSYRIEYQWTGLVLTAQTCPGLDEPRWVIAVEGGDNNCYVEQHGRARRARDWEISMIGTERQVLRQATRWASACEGGMLKPGGRDCSPEAYIGRIRRLLAQPVMPQMALNHLGLGARLAADHPLAARDPEPGFTLYPHREFGEERVKLIPAGCAHWARYFALIDPWLEDFSLSPWRTGELYGLPRS